MAVCPPIVWISDEETDRMGLWYGSAVEMTGVMWYWDVRTIYGGCVASGGVDTLQEARLAIEQEIASLYADMPYDPEYFIKASDISNEAYKHFGINSRPMDELIFDVINWESDQIVKAGIPYDLALIGDLENENMHMLVDAFIMLYRPDEWDRIEERMWESINRYR